jgi:hypothetical protein
MKKTTPPQPSAPDLCEQCGRPEYPERKHINSTCGKCRCVQCSKTLTADTVNIDGCCKECRDNPPQPSAPSPCDFTTDHSVPPTPDPEPSAPDLEALVEELVEELVEYFNCGRHDDEQRDYLHTFAAKVALGEAIRIRQGVSTTRDQVSHQARESNEFADAMGDSLDDRISILKRLAGEE